MTIIRTLVIALILTPALALFGAAQEAGPVFPEAQTDTVSDFASVLNATEEGRIGRILAETRESTGVQIVVVTTPGIDSMGGSGMRLGDFGRALFDAWGIGDKQKNDGIMILIDTEAREARIALGSGYPAVYDERAARVLSTALLPVLLEGRIAPAIEAAIISARDQLVAPFQAGTNVNATDGFAAAEQHLTSKIGIALAAILGLAGFSLWRRARSRRMCPNCGAATLKREQEIIAAATRFQDGLGLQHLTCSSCGFVDRRPFPIKYSEKEDRRGPRNPPGPADPPGEGERGFGGGKSDGGGASGKW